MTADRGGSAVGTKTDAVICRPELSDRQECLSSPAIERLKVGDVFVGITLQFLLEDRVEDRDEEECQRSRDS